MFKFIRKVLQKLGLASEPTAKPDASAPKEVKIAVEVIQGVQDVASGKATAEEAIKEAAVDVATELAKDILLDKLRHEKDRTDRRIW